MTLIFFMGFALSLDAFSVGIALGLINNDVNKHIKYSLSVGIMHFIMPSLGSITNSIFLRGLLINSNRLVGIILIILVIQLILDTSNNKEINLNSFVLAFGVSIDSFFAGVGLEGIVKHHYYYLIFSLLSMPLSLLGCKLGSIKLTKYEKLSRYIAISILTVLSIKYLLF